MLPQKEYDLLAASLAEFCGMELGPDKQYLVESRLQPIADRFGCASIAEVVGAMSVPGELRQAVIDAMTTNESLFFRDATPFEMLRQKILPALRQARQGGGFIRIWSAGCSTGQEPYSIAMLLSEMEEELRGLHFEILATDLSTSVLERAKEGIYSGFEAQRGLSPELLRKYFIQVDGGCRGGCWRVNDSIRSRVQFQELNLIESFHELGSFDIIFCRYVLIYLSARIKRSILDRFAEILRPDGYLVLGGTETILGLSEALEGAEGLSGAIYRKKERLEWMRTL